MRPRKSRRTVKLSQPEGKAPAAAAGAAAPAAPEPSWDDGSTAAVATGLWRMRNKMVQPGTDVPLPEVRGLYRHLESTWDALAGAGVEIQSHDGAAADPGLSLSVVAYQPTPGLDRERVIETIRPTVYHHGRIIQQGEVIVGTPEDEPIEPPAPPHRELKGTQA
jgi:hypothetical protein